MNMQMDALVSGNSLKTTVSNRSDFADNTRDREVR